MPKPATHPAHCQFAAADVPGRRAERGRHGRPAARLPQPDARLLRRSAVSFYLRCFLSVFVPARGLPAARLFPGQTLGFFGALWVPGGVQATADCCSPPTTSPHLALPCLLPSWFAGRPRTTSRSGSGSSTTWCTARLQVRSVGPVDFFISGCLSTWMWEWIKHDVVRGEIAGECV